MSVNPPGIREVSAWRFAGQQGHAERCAVVEEQTLAIDVEGIGAYALMWTPTEAVELPCGYTAEDGVLGAGGIPEILALAAGFAFTERLYDHRDDIRSLAVCADNPEVVRLALKAPEHAIVQRRNVVIGSSCGVCGGREQIENALQGLPNVGRQLSLPTSRLEAILTTMLARQPVWQASGGTHAAAIFDSEGSLLALAEDLGRHNALDKVIGHCLLAGHPLAGCGVALSSRVTYEMTSKAVRAGLEMIAAVSAVSTLAIEIADRFGVTLCGFVRPGRATAFTHAERLTARNA